MLYIVALLDNVYIVVTHLQQWLPTVAETIQLLQRQPGFACKDWFRLEATSSSYASESSVGPHCGKCRLWHSGLLEGCATYSGVHSVICAVCTCCVRAGCILVAEFDVTNHAGAPLLLELKHFILGYRSSPLGLGEIRVS